MAIPAAPPVLVLSTRKTSASRFTRSHFSGSTFTEPHARVHAEPEYVSKSRVAHHKQISMRETCLFVAHQ